MLKPPYSEYSRIYTYHIDGDCPDSLDDPDLVGSWVEDGKTIFVFHKPKERLMEEFCQKHGCDLFYQADLDYRDWEMGREVEPFTVGPLRVAPVWYEGKADIRIDPSVVFGNGFHPSTRLCLEALVKYSSLLDPGFSGLDLGCGTGLLSIGAARLGASSMTAIDFNSLACAVTEQNAIHNNVKDIIRVRNIDLRIELPDTKVDVVVANLHHSLLVQLFSRPSFWKAKLYILSGFMLNEEEELLAALPPRVSTFVDRGAMDKWRLWVMDRTDR